MKTARNGDLTTWPDCANEPTREKDGGRAFLWYFRRKDARRNFITNSPSLTDPVAEMTQSVGERVPTRSIGTRKTIAHAYGSSGGNDAERRERVPTRSIGTRKTIAHVYGFGGGNDA